jgi:FlaA1/EpsC-like NDP-sugar epimerase
MAGLESIMFNHIPSTQANLTKPVKVTRIKDQSIIVTGGASGFGREMVKVFAEAGYVDILSV